MLKKAFGSFLLVFALCFSIASTSFANTSSPSDEAEDTKTDKIPINHEIQSQLLSNGNLSVTITDESELERIAAERGLEKIPTKIEYEYQAIETDSTPIMDLPNQEICKPGETDSTIVSPYAIGQICYVKDYGTGFYNKSTDLYQSFIVDGPDTFIIDKTITKTSKFDGSFGFPIKVVEASIGFQIGVEESVRFQSNTPILATQRGTFNLYTTYRKVMYAIDNGNTCLIGYAYKPVGTYIEKIFVNK